MSRYPPAGHLPRDHPHDRRAGSHRCNDTSRTSWRGGVLCSAPCKGRPPDASRASPRARSGSRPRPTPTTPSVPARGRWRARAADITAAPGSPRLLTRCCIMHHAAPSGNQNGLRWRRQPHGHRPRAHSPAPALPSPTPEDASAPGARPSPLPAPPSRGPTRRLGPLQGDPDPGSYPGAGGGRALTAAAGGPTAGGRMRTSPPMNSSTRCRTTAARTEARRAGSGSGSCD